MNYNILITSAGKRVELLMEFKKELKANCPNGKVYAADLNPAMAPACFMADGYFEVPRVTDPAYIDRLLEICGKYGIRLIIPTIDTELLILSENRGRFLSIGTKVIVSDPHFIKVCRDKRLTMQLFQKLSIKNPELRDKTAPIFPMFAKPYDGSLSSNIHVIRNQADLTQEILADPKLIFMELVDKNEYQEYTVDLYFDKYSHLKSIVPRLRIEVRAGEVNKARACKNYIVEFLRDRLTVLPEVRGCVCMQLFYRASDNDIIGIEINPRFGGGYPLSYYSGANFPGMLIKEYIHKKNIEYSDNWKDGTTMLRYDSQIITNS